MKFSELVDISELRELCESFTSFTGAATAIIDLEGNVLTAAGWQIICTHFHRVNPAAASRCRESDTVLAGLLGKGENFNVYKCKNGLIDVAVPINIGGEHVANFFTGQFFFKSPDEEYFLHQAEEFSFDKDSYIEALNKVPIFSEDKVRGMMEFFTRLAQLIGEMGLARNNLGEANRELQEKIAERKQMEGEIERLNTDLAARAAELEAANLELEAFNYSVSHDLRVPLSVISGYTQIIEAVCSDVMGERCKAYLPEISKGVSRMTELIDALLNFSQATHSELRRETFNLSSVAKEIVEELVQVAPERRTTIKLAEGIEVSGDSSLLRVALANLLGNAWKYTSQQEEAVIEFGVTTVGKETAYFVRDNGPGFDMADAERLFAPFQRLAGKAEFAGHGIGLATVERIIKRHGGRVWAEGVLGKGATFYFTLANGRRET